MKVKKTIVSGTVMISLLVSGGFTLDYLDEKSKKELTQKAINGKELMMDEFYMLIDSSSKGLINESMNNFRDKDNKVRILDFNRKENMFWNLKNKEALLEDKKK